MARPTIQSKDYKFTVSQLQLKHPVTGKPLPRFGNFRDDTQELLGVTTDEYGLLQNTDLLQAAHEALNLRGLTGYTEDICVAGNGERFYAEFTFKNKQLASAVGDVFGYRLTLKNSFDRSMRAAWALGFLRLTCLNGASTMEREFAVTAKHSTRISVEFVAKALEHALERAPEALQVYDQLAKTRISEKQGLNILGNLQGSDVVSGVVAEGAEALWLAPKRAEDKERNLYNLYNALTEYLTHQVQKERYEYATKTSTDLLTRLVGAARDKKRFEKLIVAPPKPAGIVLN